MISFPSPRIESQKENTRFTNAFSVILHTSLALMFTYCWYLTDLLFQRWSYNRLHIFPCVSLNIGCALL